MIKTVQQLLIPFDIPVGYRPKIAFPVNSINSLSNETEISIKVGFFQSGAMPFV